MRVVVAGGGNVGRHLAADLLSHGHDVTLIEQEPATLDRAAQWEGLQPVLGDACEPWVLEQARMSTADVVVAATGDDEDNLVIALLCKQEFGVPRVLARVNHPNNEWMFNEQWGVDTAVSPPHIITSLVEEAVTVGDVIRLMPLADGTISLVELRVPASAPVAGRPMQELHLPADTAITAIVREGHVLFPQPETVIAANDELVALTSPASESALRDAILG